MYGWTCVCGCTWCACMFRWRSEVNAGFFFISLSPLYTETGSLTYTKSPPVGLLQLASLLLHFYLYFPPTKITGRSSCPLDIYIGAGDLSSGSHAGLARPLPAEPSPEPPLLFLTYEKHCMQWRGSDSYPRIGFWDQLLSPVGQWHFPGFLSGWAWASDVPGFESQPCKFITG